ncbi:MAG: energy-coupling factor transporter transmembrane component T [Desulfobacterales bacterium]|jgi:energy-coupling factor transporter transmembrane protein EcfT
MAELTNFSYRAGNSLMHSLDVRFKLAALVIFSLATLHAEWLTLSVASLMLVIVFWNARLPLKSVLREIRFFLLLLLLVIAARALTTPGVALIQIKSVIISRQGIRDGALIAWRLLLIVFLALPFIASTRPSEIRAAVEWFLAPFPFLPRNRIATMLSLVMRFVPVIFDQARETADAQRARGVECRKSPVYRAVKYSIPMIRNVFATADELAVAMEARCYSENRSAPEFRASLRDWMILMASICLFLLN